MVKITAFLTVSLFIGLTAAKIVWKDCGSTKGSVKDVLISVCDDEPCEIKKGSNVTFTVKFETNSDEKTNNVTAVVHGIVAGLPVPFPLPQPDGCQDSGLVCPLKASSSYTYTQILPVQSSYPSIKVVVKWELKDTSSNDIVCIETPISIVSSTARSGSNDIHPRLKVVN